MLFMFPRKNNSQTLNESVHTSDMSFHQRSKIATEVNEWLHLACQDRLSDLGMHAETYKEDFDLDRLPTGWGPYPSLDANDVRAKFISDVGIAFAWRFGAIVFVEVPKETRHREVDLLRESLGLPLRDPRVTAEKFSFSLIQRAPLRLNTIALYYPQLTRSGWEPWHKHSLKVWLWNTTKLL